MRLPALMDWGGMLIGQAEAGWKIWTTDLAE